MAEPFATNGDYTRRGYDASKFDSTAVLNERLAGASRFLRRRAPNVDAQIDAETLDLEYVADVVCLMVKRTVPAQGLEGVTTDQFSMGPFQQTRGLANPNGDFYLTAEEKRALGIGRQKAGSVDLLAAPPDDTEA